jgi:hypothetical protein
MPTMILKGDRDTDLYCQWSTVVDAPTWVGTRDELLASLLTHPDAYSSYLDMTPRQVITARVDRADLTGTSAYREYGFGEWDSNGFIVGHHTGIQGGGFRWLGRGDLTAYLTALRDEQWQAAYDITTPIPDDDTDPAA